MKLFYIVSEDSLNKWNSIYGFQMDFVKSILPIKNIVLETAIFDPHLLKNPKLYNEKYRKY